MKKYIITLAIVGSLFQSLAILLNNTPEPFRLTLAKIGLSLIVVAFVLSLIWLLLSK